MFVFFCRLQRLSPGATNLIFFLSIVTLSKSEQECVHFMFTLASILLSNPTLIILIMLKISLMLYSVQFTQFPYLMMMMMVKNVNNQCLWACVSISLCCRLLWLLLCWVVKPFYLYQRFASQILTVMNYELLLEIYATTLWTMNPHSKFHNHERTHTHTHTSERRRKTFNRAAYILAHSKSLHKI